MSIDIEKALEKIIKEINDNGYEKQMNLKTSEVSRLLGVSNSTLEKWRKEGIGINYNQVGGRVFYTKQSIAEWILRSQIRTA
jgi:predicted site-specific integrase-resolvase